MLQNRSSTTMVVPTGEAAWRISVNSPASTTARVPKGASCVRVVSVTRDTAAIEASASPRKPRVWML